MSNILVVDDEVIQRRVLAKMIRDARPGCSVLEAKNGQEALDVIRDGRIDIVFTDIKMPVLDGLAFIEKMNASPHKIRVIILSGYRYFEYAQKAIQLGAFDYLVKPVKEESICAVLDKVDHSIQQETMHVLAHEQIRQQLDRTQTAYYENLLTDWVTEGVSPLQYAELRDQFALEETGIVVIARIGSNRFHMKPMEKESRVKNALLSSLEMKAGLIGPSVSFFSREDKRLLIAVATSPRSYEVDHQTLAREMEACVLTASEQFGIELTIGIGEWREDIGHEARYSFKEALTAAPFRYFLPDCAVIPYSEVRARIQPLHYDYAREEAQFKEAIRQNRNELILRQTDEWLDRIVADGFPYPEQWQQAVLRMISAVAGVVKDFVTDEVYKQMLSDTETHLAESPSFPVCRGRFQEVLLQWSELLIMSRSKKRESVVEACIQYIDTHYMEDLSLDTVAAHLFFSPSSVSIMLKNHLGVTFSKYLSQVRIQKGIELLQNSEMKVYEIASKVGFKDDKYFYRVFKSRFGMTPDEYRRNQYLMHLSND
ncbi:response regulator [Paenibacillus whitsoniae]|uniref:Response regulator n=1 Tax=Paenibacillus whitsoniae TaxID=2496558 RepID=A0A430JL19_9BACL|nr:response regulator [Paenibacillus whitsoniae]RTE11709.1 response regulator [Paenibacillus whitsoniae]